MLVKCAELVLYVYLAILQLVMAWVCAPVRPGRSGEGIGESGGCVLVIVCERMHGKVGDTLF